MNKAHVLTLAGYNNWTDALAMEWLGQIDDRQWEQEISSSFSSIRQTAVHIVSAKKIWIDFWTHAPDPVYLSAAFKGTKQDLLATWKNVSANLENFIESYPEDRYGEPVTFRYPRGGEAQLAFWQTFSHFINHATYHRGQLVTLLRQAGFTGFSSTDLVTYLLTHQSKMS